MRSFFFHYRTAKHKHRKSRGQHSCWLNGGGQPLLLLLLPHTWRPMCEVFVETRAFMHNLSLRRSELFVVVIVVTGRLSGLSDHQRVGGSKPSPSVVNLRCLQVNASECWVVGGRRGCLPSISPRAAVASGVVVESVYALGSYTSHYRH